MWVAQGNIIKNNDRVRRGRSDGCMWVPIHVDPTWKVQAGGAQQGSSLERPVSKGQRQLASWLNQGKKSWPRLKHYYFIYLFCFFGGPRVRLMITLEEMGPTL